jgi:hypothetical protein
MRKLMAANRTSYDRNIFLLIIIIALAVTLNVRGLIVLLQHHLPLSTAFQLPAFGFVISIGGIVGLFSRRIASSITAWRDEKHQFDRL